MAKPLAAWFCTGTLYRIGPFNVAWWRHKAPHAESAEERHRKGGLTDAALRLAARADRPLGAAGRSAPCPSGSQWGHDLYRLPLAAFRAYVGGIQDGQAALAEALGIQPVICLDVHMTRNDLASLVLYALPKLPSEVMNLPAANVVFRVLIDNAPCPDLQGSLGSRKDLGVAVPVPALFFLLPSLVQRPSGPGFLAPIPMSPIWEVIAKLCFP